MTTLFKLSPSDLTFLWDECKRCFYLKVVHQFNRPRAPFPKIFGRIDKLMNAYFSGKRSAEISPNLPDGMVEYGEKWVVSHPISLPDRQSRCIIRGRFDTALTFMDGTFGVVDFKTTEPNPGHIAFYSRQLHAYAYALEHPAPGKFGLSPVTKLGLLCVEPTGIDQAEDGRIAYLGDVSWLEIPKDEGRFLDFIRQVLAILEQPSPPPGDPKCTYCQYRDQSREGEW